jgi:hypothetical protein
MNNSVVSGALFDFLGWLRSRPGYVVFGLLNDEPPMLALMKEWAGERRLDLEFDVSDVRDWRQGLRESGLRVSRLNGDVLYCDRTANMEGRQWPAWIDIVSKCVDGTSTRLKYVCVGVNGEIEPAEACEGLGAALEDQESCYVPLTQVLRGLAEMLAEAEQGR